VLIGSGTELACRGACFIVSLCIDGGTFQIDAFLLPIGNNIDIILGPPWMKNMGKAIWDFTSLQMQF
jgi:hypothetical protein